MMLDSMQFLGVWILSPQLPPSQDFQARLGGGKSEHVLLQPRNLRFGGWFCYVLFIPYVVILCDFGVYHAIYP